MPAPPLLFAEHLARRYGDRVAVEAVSLQVARGEVLGLLGLNGAGKSTTLQMLAGVLVPNRGRILLNGHDLARAPRAAKRHLGYLPEIPPLFSDATVDEYLAFCARLHEAPAARVPALVARVKDRCNLSAVGPRLIRNLSKGFQQRVGIAQALVHEPAILILDEPTVGLDPAQIQEVRELIRALREEHAIVLSTHLLGEAESLCSRVAILHHGRLVHDAPVGTQQGIVFGLRTPPPLSVLRSALAATPIIALGQDRFEVQTDSREVLVDRIVARAVEQQWGLCELSRGGSALERTFLDLTREHRTHGGAG